jgi:hypothetical protein
MQRSAGGLFQIGSALQRVRYPSRTVSCGQFFPRRHKKGMETRTGRFVETLASPVVAYKCQPLSDSQITALKYGVAGVERALLHFELF